MLVSKTGSINYRKTGSEILQMRLQRLTSMEQDKIISEYNEIILYIADLLDILSKPERVLSIIDDDLNFLKEKFGDQESQ